MNVRLLTRGKDNTPETMPLQVFREHGSKSLTLKPAYDAERHALAALFDKGKVTGGIVAAWEPDVLVFNLTLGTATVQFRCQSTGDASKLCQLCPRDWTLDMEAAWDDAGLTFRLPAKPEPVEKTPEQAETERLRTLSHKDLQTEAAIAGVEWDKKASIETMRDRIHKKKFPPVPAEAPAGGE